MLKLLVIPTVVVSFLMVQGQQECVSIEAFAKTLQEQVSPKQDELILLNGDEGTKILNDLSTPVKGVTNVLVYSKQDVSAMFVFVKGCYVGHLTGTNKGH